MSSRNCIANIAGRQPPQRCRKRALFFGRWAGGGFCAAHLAAMFRDDPHFDRQLHAESRELYEQMRADGSFPPPMAG